MKAVGFAKPLPVSDPSSLLDLELPDPIASGHDLLVEIRAVSVNPADTQLRASGGTLPGNEYRILGYDAAGIVRTDLLPNAPRHLPMQRRSVLARTCCPLEWLAILW